MEKSCTRNFLSISKYFLKSLIMVKRVLAFILLLSLLLYLPSFFNFYTNDDFFHLSISKAKNVSEFLNFFNLISAPQGFGFYRPLTTQAYYFLSYYFNYNPIILHVISFAVLIMIILLVFNISKKLTANNYTSLLAVFFYAVSATHFGHLYYIATFQELGFSLFYLLSMISFINFLKEKKIRYYFFMIITLVGALLSKESAVTLPASFLLIILFYVGFRFKALNLRQIIFILSIPILILLVYLYFHVFYYGLAKGDSYVWIVSFRVVNTVVWYVLWSLNIPEMLVDYIGPGLHVNPNLLKFYWDKIIPIIILFGVIILELLFVFVKTLKKSTKKDVRLYLFAIFWFLITLLPVIFLPLHKFSYELTLPLFAVALVLGNLIAKVQKYKLLICMFLSNYLLLSVLTNILSYQTSWIVRGAVVAERVFSFAERIERESEVDRTIVFYDEPDDRKLLWLPSSQLKQILSDNNFFRAYYGNKVKAIYLNQGQELSMPDAIMVRARNFF